MKRRSKLISVCTLIMYLILVKSICTHGTDDPINSILISQTRSVETKISATLYAGITKETQKIQQSNIIDIKWRTAYTIENVNVRLAPSMNSDIISSLEFNTPITVADMDDEWAIVKVGEIGIYYISNNYISYNPNPYKEVLVPKNSGMKTYMPYTAISSKSSYQYKLQSQYAYTGQYGIRQVKGRFCVAIGTAFNATVGTYVDLILENETAIPCVVADIKADAHTKEDNITTIASGCVSEFVCDTKSLTSKAKSMGDVSYVEESWNSKVVSVKVYEKNVFE